MSAGAGGAFPPTSARNGQFASNGDHMVAPGPATWRLRMLRSRRLGLLHCEDFRDDAKYPAVLAKLIENLRRPIRNSARSSPCPACRRISRPARPDAPGARTPCWSISRNPRSSPAPTPKVGMQGTRSRMNDRSPRLFLRLPLKICSLAGGMGLFATAEQGIAQTDAPGAAECPAPAEAQARNPAIDPVITFATCQTTGTMQTKLVLNAR